MGFFSKLLNDTAESNVPRLQNEAEAIMASLYAVAASDGVVSEVEVDFISRLCVFKQYFTGYDIVMQYEKAMVIHKKIGSQRLIEMATPLIQAENRITVFLMILDVMFVDGVVEDEEEQIIDFVSKKYGILESRAQDMVDIMLLRNKGNVKIA